MTPLQQILDLTRALGQPQHEYVIIGEGNTSLRVDADTFLIKASGRGMSSIDESGFVAVRFDPIMALFEQQDADRAALQQAMIDAKVDPDTPGRPSVEVTFHAMLLRGCDVQCIAHTHPVAVNGLLCSTRARQFADHRLFPDEVVLCGPRSVFVPYVDPGLPLAAAIRAEVRGYMEEFGEAPKVILLQNHGLIALAQTPTEALNITAMCVKAAKIFAGACAAGDPVFMTEADIMHIYRRPDEIYRRRMFVG
jgi:rhamnose utilization protein RhaD (predicted bifunctional aldolase and dehydrogenase)